MKTFKTTSLKMVLAALLCLTFSSTLFAQDNNSYIVSKDGKEVEWLPAPEFFPGCSFTVLHGDLAEPNLDFFFRIEPNTDVVMHTHQSAERMILVSGELEVQYEGEGAAVMKVGNYAFGPAGKPHRAKCLDKGPCVLFVGMNEPFTAVPVTKK